MCQAVDLGAPVQDADGSIKTHGPATEAAS